MDRSHSESGALERRLREVVSTHIDGAAERIPEEATFESLGLDSAQAVAIAGELGRLVGRPLPDSLLYDHPTIGQLVAHLERGHRRASVSRAEAPFAERAVAVVGLGCRFPGCAGPGEFWGLLDSGIDAIGDPSEERVELVGDGWPPGGYLSALADFDPGFFGISPRESASMDPQQRWLLEVAWEALEDAMIDPGSLAGSRTGVFIGISNSDYGSLQLGSVEQATPHAAAGSSLSVAANRISYLLDARGPSMAVDTACSSSLVALHVALAAMSNGECDIALVGGVNVILRAALTESLRKLGLLSTDGRTRAYSADAGGYGRGEGAGVIVLKSREAAIRDGDRIYGLIKGSATNANGRGNGLTAPRREQQVALLQAAYERAGVEPSSISYLEGHGTATPIGDAVEAGAAGSVLGEGRALDDVCALGCVKTNIGHLESASGIAAVIKALLALERRRIPASLHCSEPSADIPFDRLPLQVPTKSQPWCAEGPLRAGVSALGFGGANAHVVLEEAP